MERSRESKRAATIPRRLRISCPKDPADAEARMDETPLIEKVKKRNLQALPASFHATPTAWSKRKRNWFQEAHHLSAVINSGKGLAESTPAEEYEDEVFHEAVNSKQRAKKDELVMNIYNVPRRARSSAARFPSLRRHLEPCFVVASSQQVAATSKQRSPSPRILASKEEKLMPAGIKSRLLKDLTVMESAQISDQEVEVAEVLFDLSRSMPSFVQSTSIKCEEKSCKGLEEEDLKSSSSQVVEQKSKRQRDYDDHEVTLCIQSAEGVNGNTGCCVSGRLLSATGASEVDELQFNRGLGKKICCKQRELLSRDIVKERCYGHSQLPVADDKHTSHVDERGQDIKASGGSPTHVAEQISHQGSSSLSTNKSELGGQVYCKGGDCSKISSRQDGLEASGTSSKEDRWCPSQKMSSEEELNTDYKRLVVSESSSSLVEDCSGKVVLANNDTVNQGDKGRGAPVKDESGSCTKDVHQGWNGEPAKAALNPVKEEQVGIRPVDVRRDDKMVSDASSGFPLPSTISLSSNGAATCMGWMGAYPQLNVYTKTGPPWLVNCTRLGSSAHPAVQLPHATSVQHTVQRIMRCATHVYVAHFIQQQQQVHPRAFWPTACNPCNVNIVPANLQGKEQLSNTLPSPQAECGDTSAECMGMKMPPSRGTVSNAKNGNCMAGSRNSAHVLPVGVGSIKGFGKSMMAHTQQSKQTIMQLNNSGTVCIPLSGFPAQNASIINKLPQNLAHQAPSPSHFPKLQQGHHASLHAGLSHSHATQPRVQLQEQVQYEQLKQHRPYLTSSPQLYGTGSHGFLEGNRLFFR